MNVTRGAGRPLRERKPVNYNLHAMEVGAFDVDEDVAKPFRGKGKAR